MGVTSQGISTGGGGMFCESVKKIAYICAPKTFTSDDACGCSGNDNWEALDVINHRYKKTDYQINCNTPWVICDSTDLTQPTAMGSGKMCSLNTSITMTYYSCEKGYYKSGNNCKECPQTENSDGDMVAGQSINYNTGVITS